jgi:hypothetical protein
VPYGQNAAAQSGCKFERSNWSTAVGAAVVAAVVVVVVVVAAVVVVVVVVIAGVVVRKPITEAFEVAYHTMPMLLLVMPAVPDLVSAQRHQLPYTAV